MVVLLVFEDMGVFLALMEGSPMISGSQEDASTGLSYIHRWNGRVGVLELSLLDSIRICNVPYFMDWSERAALD